MNGMVVDLVDAAARCSEWMVDVALDCWIAGWVHGMRHAQALAPNRDHTSIACSVGREVMDMNHEPGSHALPERKERRPVLMTM